MGNKIANVKATFNDGQIDFTDLSGNVVFSIKTTGVNIPANELFIAATAVTATAAELNANAGVAAGTASASKAAVLGANKNLDVLAVADLKLGAGAGTSLTPTAAEINSLAGIATGKFIPGQRFHVTYPQVAAADVAKTFFIAPAACKVISAYERHVTVAGQAGTLQIEKLTSGTAPGSGVVTLGAAWDLTSTANTPVSKSGIGTADGTLAAGDALCLKLASGSAASYALGSISITMEVL